MTLVRTLIHSELYPIKKTKSMQVRSTPGGQSPGVFFRSYEIDEADWDVRRYSKIKAILLLNRPVLRTTSRTAVVVVDAADRRIKSC